VLELIEGGELFERIQKKDHYSERDARLIMQQLASAMAVAHMRNICHRDLKPENILLASKTDDTSLKVADLGFAKVLKGKNQLLSTPCGTPGYVAPEVIAGNPSYTVACDVWSLGVILFILLCGYPPFMAEDQAQLFNDIKAGRFEMDPTYWRGISLPAQDLVRRLLVVNPAKRLTAEQILSHPWVLNASAVPNTHLSSAMEGVRKLVARRRLRKAIAAVRLTVRMKLRMAALNSLDARRRGADPQAAFFAGARQVPSRPASSDDSEYPAALLEAGRARGGVHSRISDFLPPRDARRR
jgi:calcium/calmodulin-dependent protein kinase I